jgi:hypothetical protein
MAERDRRGVSRRMLELTCARSNFAVTTPCGVLHSDPVKMTGIGNALTRYAAATVTCFGCHAHEPPRMATEQVITDIANLVACPRRTDDD